MKEKMFVTEFQWAFSTGILTAVNWFQSTNEIVISEGKRPGTRINGVILYFCGVKTCKSAISKQH
jgi:hypothetical protein